jgi:hypothetical protein
MYSTCNFKNERFISEVLAGRRPHVPLAYQVVALCNAQYLPYNLEFKQQRLSDCATRLSDLATGRSHLATVA